MPDISMCPSPDCPARLYCHRNEASGTKPSEWRQSWIGWTWRQCDGAVICDGYWPEDPALLAQAEAPSTSAGGKD